MLIKKIILTIVAGLTLFTFFALPTAGVYAGLQEAFTTGGPLGKVADKAGYDTANRTLDSLTITLVDVILSALGLIFLINMIVAGFIWMTSAGNEEKIKKAKGVLIASLIGLLVVIAAYAITFFVFKNIVEASKLVK
jgi:hypothetical protein